MKIIELEEVDSTNEYCKRRDDGEDLTVIAYRQTYGKGTKGRAFVSDSGGLYITVMRHYSDFSASQAFEIMVNACVGVCRTVEAFGVTPVIRWANDVLADGLKISGTLIENVFSGDKIIRSVVGIGINLNNTLPAELDGIAASLCALTGCRIDLNEFKSVLIGNLSKSYTIEEYKKYMPWLGADVILRTSDGERTVTATDVSDDGRLVIKDGSAVEKISAAEVSLRLK